MSTPETPTRIAARRAGHGSYLVAMVLAIGICTAVNLFTLAVLYDALFNTPVSGLSENATQVLTGWGGGIIGVIGAVVGYNAGQSAGAKATAPTPTATVPPMRSSLNS